MSRVFRRPFRRSEVWAVRDLSLTIERGEIFGLVGPNGSGKTTTLQMALGLLSPTAGTIEVLGGPPGSAEARRRTGYLPEEFEGYPFLSGAEALRFYGGFFGLSRAEVRRRADELLAALDLFEDRRRRLREYSKGMRRRIGLAQSLLHDPELIVLDEPTNGLDPVGIIKVKQMLRSLKARGRTIVISSHILPEMEDLCDRVAVLAAGRVLASGPLAGLLGRPGRHRALLSGRVPSREELAAILRGAGIELLGLEEDSRTLEDLFLSLVGRDGGGQPRG